MKLSIIIVSFNTKTFLKECLKSLVTGHPACADRQSLVTDYEIVVVDNASKDGSAEMVAKDFPWVKLIKNKENFGFAKAANQGIKKTRGENVLFLNSDTHVKPGSLEKLIQFAQKHPEAGVIGAGLINPDGSVQPSVYHFPTLNRAINEYWLGKNGVYEKYAPQDKMPIEVEAVTGAAMLIPRKTIDKIGLLGERYFMYFEDLDYCGRVRRAGLKVFYLPSAEILHHHGQSAVKVGSKAYQDLIRSSKIYNGLIKYYLLFLIIWIGLKWRKILEIK